jgi:hypothetical protein
MDTVPVGAAPRSRLRILATTSGAAGLLWTAAYLQHPPGEGVSLAGTMEVVLEHTTAWRWSHLGIAAGYLLAGLAAVLTLRWRGPRGLARAGWTATAVTSVPLVGYLVVEATVAARAALAGDAEAFELWYGTVAVWTWRVAWPVFFGGIVLVAVAAWRSAAMPKWGCAAAAVGAGFGAFAPVFGGLELPGLAFAAFLTPLLAWGWLPAYGIRAVVPEHPGRTELAVVHDAGRGVPRRSPLGLLTAAAQRRSRRGRR